MAKFVVSLAIFLSLLSSTTNSFAVHSTILDAKALRNKIIYRQEAFSQKDKLVNKRIVLPVSRGFDQQDTCLCWSYAFFSALETLYRVKHPDTLMEISRGAMQYINMQDRFDLAILGIEDHINPKEYKDCWAEGGTPLSAKYILQHYGATPYSAYHDIVSPPDYRHIYHSIFSGTTTTKQKKQALSPLLANYFSYEIPDKVFFDGQWMSNLTFANAILPKFNWITYAISKDNSDYYGPGLDPDKRRNEQTHFVPKEVFIQKLKTALENNRPIVYSNDHHVILIYGADFDKSGNILYLYIKDSYESLGYFYKANFENALMEVSEVTIPE